MLVKVKAKTRFNEAGILRVPGDLFEIDYDRARALGGSVEIIEAPKQNELESENKQIIEPPMHRSGKKGKK